MLLSTIYVLSCAMLSVLARRATDHFGPPVTQKATETTTHVSAVSSTSPSESPASTRHAGFTEPSSCTDAQHAAIAMDLRHSPNAPLFPNDWPKGCEDIQASLRQVADAFLPTAYLPKEKFNEVARKDNCKLDLRVRGGSVVLGQTHLEELIATGLARNLRGRVAVQGRMVCAKLNGTDERVDVEWMMVPILRDGNDI